MGWKILPGNAFITKHIMLREILRMFLNAEMICIELMKFGLFVTLIKIFVKKSDKICEKKCIEMLTARFSPLFC